MLKPWTYVLILIVMPSLVDAQDFSNRGRDFWVGYGNHVKMAAVNQSNAQEMVLYITSAQNANFKIEIPGTGWSYTGFVMANAVISSPPIPKSGLHDARLVNEGLYKRGIHITSDRAIVAYAHVYNQNVSGASLLFPVNVLGIEYYSINFTQQSNEPGSYSWFYAVATEDNTLVEIVSSKNTRGGKIAGVPFQVTLMKGEIYNVLSDEDLTGSKIRSISSGTTSCKKIAVFSGTGKIYIACNNNQNSADNIMQQAFPAGAWGKKYLTAPTQGMPNNIYRVAVGDPATQVLVNGLPLTGLQQGFYYEFASGTPNIIEATQPVMVAQYISTQQECGNNMIGLNGDPEMIYLSPVEQTIDKITLNSTPNYQISQHYINVILKANAVNSFKLDGVAMPGQFVPHPVDGAYAYAQLAVVGGPHQLRADSGFNAISYGYGNFESYGYNAGANVVDLYQYLTITNQHASTNSPAVCKDLPFTIALTLPYQPSKLVWDIPLYPTITDNAPAYTEAIMKDGKLLYVYKLPGTYVYNTPGVHSLKVTVDNPTAQGCSGQQEIEYDFEVFGKPVADFTAGNECAATAATFHDISDLGERKAIQWYWDFGDLNTGTTQQPEHIYQFPGTYNVRFTVMTDIGCVADTITRQVVIKQAPVAKFGTSGVYCANNRILISDSSVLHSPVPIIEWQWDLGDGSAPLYHTTAPTPFHHVYANAGTYTLKLVVKSQQGCYSVAFEQTITIHALPTAEFQLPGVVCLPDGRSSFRDQSVNHSMAGPLIYKWYFGDPHADPSNPDSSILQHPTHIYSQPGNYPVRLLVVSPEGCKAGTMKVFSSIYSQVTAGMGISKTDSCAGAIIGFTDASDSRGRNIRGWMWDFGDGANSTIVNPVHQYPVADTFELSHYMITEEGCHSDTIKQQLIIHAIPVAAYTWGNARCEKQALQLLDASTVQGDRVVKWNWDFGDHTTLGTTTGIVTHTWQQAGNYPLTLQVETDKGCRSTVLSNTVQIHSLPAVKFQLPEACLLDPFALFTDQSSIADHTEAQFTWSWNFGDPTDPLNNQSPVQHGQHHYTAAGDYPVQLKVTSSQGCADSLTQSFTLNGASPVADFTIDQGVKACNDQTIRIRNTSTVDMGRITRLEIWWDYVNHPSVMISDEDPVPGKMYEYLYPALVNKASEIKQIRMMAYSGTLCVQEVIKTFTLHAKPVLEFLPVPDQCMDGAALPLTQVREINGLAGIGTFSGPGINSNQEFIPSIAGSGVHAIHFQFTSNAGCSSEKAQDIRVWSLPQAIIAVPGTTCQQSEVIFMASGGASGQVVQTWTWNFGDQSPMQSTPAVNMGHTYNNTGAYTISLQAVTDKGCRSPLTTKEVTIHPLPVVDFSIPTICLPLGKSTFTDLSSITGETKPVFNYYWDFGDPATGSNNFSSLQHPTHYYAGQGPYQVSLKVSSGKGCTATGSKLVTEIAQSPVAGFEVAAEACTGVPLLFTDKSQSTVKPIVAWSWQIGNDIVSTNPSLRHAFANPGAQSVSLLVTNSAGCSSAPLTRVVNIYAYPVVSAGPDLTILEGESALIQARAQGTDLQFQWTPGRYLSNASLLTPVITPIENDIYRLAVTGKAGCASYDELQVKVLKLPQVPNTFTPNGDGINDTWQIRYLDSYPANTVEVYNRQGQLVFRSAGYTTPWDGRFKGQPLPVGTYYYLIDPKEGRKRMSGYVMIIR
jgi:gliding motility-associated-like protein